MKLLTLTVVMAFQVFAFAPQGVCQEAKPQQDRPYLMHTKSPRLHFSIPPTESTGRVELTSSNAERDLGAEQNISSTENKAVLQLRGNVEVMMCPPGGHGCDNGSIILRADAVDYNEKTHEIDARGGVRIEPYRSQPQNTVIPR
jgi:hypothetical protein